MSKGAKPIKALTSAEESAFWSRVARGKENECWPWTGGKIKGYGYLILNGSGYYAHRVSWLLFSGEDPLGKCVLHKCDNPPCINPDHLYAGSHGDNMRDMFRRGRANRATGERSGSRTHIEQVPRGERWHKIHAHEDRRGESNGCAKLSESDVLNIRYLAAEEQLSQLELGKIFNMSPSSIASILHGRSWTHI